MIYNDVTNPNPVKKRIGKDRPFSFILTTNGQQQAIGTRDISLEITAPDNSTIIPTNVVFTGAKVSFTFYGKDQTCLGKYILTVWENKGKIGQTVVDKAYIIELVQHSWEEE